MAIFGIIDVKWICSQNARNSVVLPALFALRDKKIRSLGRTPSWNQWLAWELLTESYKINNPAASSGVWTLMCNKKRSVFSERFYVCMGVDVS
jgi:hypothetical protein